MEVEMDAKMRLKARIQVGRNPEFRKFLLDHPEIAKDVYSDQKVPDAPFGYTNEAPKKDAREMYIDSQPDFAPFGTIVKPDIEKVTNPLSDCWYERFVGKIVKNNPLMNPAYFQNYGFDNAYQSEDHSPSDRLNELGVEMTTSPAYSHLLGNVFHNNHL
jgi:hypothetical protein